MNGGDEQVDALVQMGMSVEEAMAIVFGEQLQEERLLEPFEMRLAKTSHGVSLKPYGEYVQERCGYCKQERSSSNFAFTLKSATPASAEALFDNCFCWSGSWCYKPLGAKSCCALYSIRLDLHEKYEESEHNRESRQRMMRFLQTEESEEVAVAAVEDGQSDTAFRVQETIRSCLNAAIVRGGMAALDTTIYVRRPTKAGQVFGVPLAALNRALKVEDASAMILDNWIEGGELQKPIVKDGYLYFLECSFVQQERPRPKSGKKQKMHQRELLINLVTPKHKHEFLVVLRFVFLFFSFLGGAEF